MKGKQIKQIIKEAINSLKKQKLNEQVATDIPITGACNPNIAATINSWDQVFDATGGYAYGNQNQGHVNALMQFFNGNAIYDGLPEGSTVKMNKDLFEMLTISFPPENRVNDILSDGQQGSWPVIEPQLHQINNSYNNVQYIYLTNTGALAGNTLYPGVIYCMYDNSQMSSITSMMQEPYSPPPTPDAGTMGGVKPGTPNLATPIKGPAKPTKQPNVSPVGMASKMPKRRMMREQVERMQKLANIKKKK